MKPLILLFAGALSAHAATQAIFDLDFSYTGGVPGGTAPWLQAVLDQVSVNEVKVTLIAADLVPREFVTSWAFNLDPVRFDQVADLTISGPTVLVGTINVTGALFNADAFGGWGNGGEKHDLEFSFQNSAGTGRFTDGEIVSFLLTAASGVGRPGTLSIEDFYFGPPDGYYTAAHIQGLANGDSAKVGADDLPDEGPPGGPEVPEASTWAAVGASTLGLLMTWHRKRRSLAA
jgi:hypothetical protein